MILSSKQKIFVIVATFLVAAPLSIARKGEQACASLWVYDKRKCNGFPKRPLPFPTWTKPGSPCYFSVVMEFSGADKVSFRTTFFVQLTFAAWLCCVSHLIISFVIFPSFLSLRYDSTAIFRRELSMNCYTLVEENVMMCLFRGVSFILSTKPSRKTGASVDTVCDRVRRAKCRYNDDDNDKQIQ